MITPWQALKMLIVLVRVIYHTFRLALNRFVDGYPLLDSFVLSSEKVADAIDTNRERKEELIEKMQRAQHDKGITIREVCQIDEELRAIPDWSDKL